MIMLSLRWPILLKAEVESADGAQLWQIGFPNSNGGLATDKRYSTRSAMLLLQPERFRVRRSAPAVAAIVTGGESGIPYDC